MVNNDGPMHVSPRTERKKISNEDEEGFMSQINHLALWGKGTKQCKVPTIKHKCLMCTLARLLDVCIITKRRINQISIPAPYSQNDSESHYSHYQIVMAHTEVEEKQSC